MSQGWGAWKEGCGRRFPESCLPWSSHLGLDHVLEVLSVSQVLPGALVPLMPTLSLDQDKLELELELVLKGSYEDTQTSALSTASAFRFHYMEAQEAELSGHLRVSLGSGVLPPTPAWDRLQLLQAPPAFPLPRPGSHGLVSLPQLDTMPLADREGHQGLGWA